MKQTFFWLSLLIFIPSHAQYAGLGEDLESIENAYSYYQQNYPDWEFTKSFNQENEIQEYRVYKVNEFSSLTSNDTEIIEIYKFENGICTQTIQQFPKSKNVLETFEQKNKEHKIGEYYFTDNHREDYQKVTQLKMIGSLPSIVTTLTEFTELPDSVRKVLQSIRPQGDYVQKSDYRILNKPILLQRLQKDSPINGTYADKYDNQLRIAELTDGKLMFLFNVGNSRSFSELEGLVVLNGNTALYEDDDFGGCIVKLTIETQKITVNNYQNNCGLGSGLTLEGVYTQQSNEIPNFKSYD